MNPGLVTGMPPQNPSGPTYSPTPIQRPQGELIQSVYRPQGQLNVIIL